MDLPLTALSHQDVLLEYEQETIRNRDKGRWLRAIEDWKEDTLALLQKRSPLCTPVVLQLIRIGPLVFTAIGAEVFSSLGDELRAAEGPGNYVVGYSNGNIGYLPFREAYR